MGIFVCKYVWMAIEKLWWESAYFDIEKVIDGYTWEI